MGGVVSNREIFHLLEAFWSLIVKAENQSAREETVVPDPEADLYSSSEATGIFDRLTVSAREIMLILKVALSRGSSQQGNARLAAVAWYARVAAVQKATNVIGR